MARKRRIAFLALLVSAVLAVSVVFAFKCEEEDSAYSAILLTITVVLEAFLLRGDSSNPLAKRVVPAEFLKLLLGLLYWYLTTLAVVAGTDRKLAFVGAWLAFLCAVVVFIGAFKLTSVATTEDAGDPASAVVSGIYTNTISALCFTFVAFLHITYFMTFALALHDKATNGRSLYRTAGFVTPLDFDPAKPVFKPDDQGSMSTCEKPHRYRVRRFFFAEGESDLESMEKFETKASVRMLYGRMCGGEQTQREAFISKLMDPKPANLSPQDALRRALYIKSAAWNLHEKYELKNVLIQLRQERRRTFSFDVVGHATNSQPERLGNGTNIDRSKTRAEATEKMIRELAREVEAPEPNFNTSAYGSERKTFLDGNHWSDASKKYWDDIEVEAGLSVEVRLVKNSSSDVNEAPRRPTLLDYSYFMIYTITTTGYGDLVPSAPFTRFLASIANLFELFFVVIIFNVILALRRSPRRERGKKLFAYLALRDQQTTPEGATAQGPPTVEDHEGKAEGG